MARIYEKTSWQFDMNRTRSPATALAWTQYQLWYIKAVLLGQIGGMSGASLWTTWGSCDSVTADTSGGDKWTSSFDATKIVRGNGAAIHSWYVLKSPAYKGKNYYILLSFDTAADTTITVKMGGTSAPTGGSTTVNPTLTPYTLNLNSNVVAVNDGVVWPRHMHAGLASDGSFHILFSRDGCQWLQSALIFHFVTGLQGNQTWPAVAFFGFNTQPLGALSDRGNSSTGGSNVGIGISANSGAFGVVLDGLNAETTPQQVSASTSSLSLLEYTTNSAGGSPSANAPGVSSSSSPDVGMNPGIDAITGGWMEAPAILGVGQGQQVSGNAPLPTVLGRFQDYSFALGAIPEGSVSPASGTPQFAKFGCLWMPVNAVPFI